MNRTYQSPPQRLAASLLLIAAAGYLALLAGKAYTQSPIADEGLIANPAYNLASHGFMGTTIVSPQSHWPNVERYTFNTLPVGILAQAAVFRLLGCSLFTARIPSMLIALTALWSIYWIVRKLTGDVPRAYLSVVLVALDCNFVAGAALARADMITLGCGLGAQAAWLLLREKSLVKASLVSAALLAIAALAHPMAIFFALFLAVMVGWLDRSRIGWRHAACAAIPFMIGFAAWYLYLRRDPNSAWLQLTANGGGHFLGEQDGEQIWTIRALAGKEMHRYINTFAIPFMPVKVLVMLCYLAGTVICVCRPAVMRKPANRFFLAETLTMALVLFADRASIPAYIVYTVPFYMIMCATAISDLRTGGLPLRMGRVIAATVVAISLGTVLKGVVKDQYHAEYLPSVRFLREHSSPDDLIVASPAWALASGFERKVSLSIDSSEGGRLNRYLVVAPTVFTNPPKTWPASSQFSAAKLAAFHPIWKGNWFWVFERADK